MEISTTISLLDEMQGDDDMRNVWHRYRHCPSTDIVHLPILFSLLCVVCARRISCSHTTHTKYLLIALWVVSTRVGSC